MHFVVICANICITYFLFDNKVLKGFPSVNILLSYKIPVVVISYEGRE